MQWMDRQSPHYEVAEFWTAAEVEEMHLCITLDSHSQPWSCAVVEDRVSTQPLLERHSLVEERREMMDWWINSTATSNGFLFCSVYETINWCWLFTFGKYFPVHLILSSNSGSLLLHALKWFAGSAAGVCVRFGPKVRTLDKDVCLTNNETDYKVKATRRQDPFHRPTAATPKDIDQHNGRVWRMQIGLRFDFYHHRIISTIPW